MSTPEESSRHSTPVFLVNLPIVAVLIVAAVRVLPADRAAADTKLDYGGAALLTGSLAALIFGLSHGQEEGFTAPEAIAALAIGIVLAIGFAPAETAVPHPMLRLALLREPARRAAYLGMLLMGAYTHAG